MDCRTCGVVNAPGRRYCRECGERLGQPCPVCHFFNGADDKHCGGCGRWLKAGAGPLAVDEPSTPPAPAVPGDAAPAPPGGRVERLNSTDTGIGGEGVSQSEIDGLFENILDEDPVEPAEDGA